MRVLGIDYGTKKIGLAFGDTETRVAVPFEVIRARAEEALNALVSLIKEESIDQLVIGMPGAVGSHTNEEQQARVRGFMKALQSKINLPIAEEDESFTTAESIRLMKEERAGAEEDALAAMLILQSYLDRIA